MRLRMIYAAALTLAAFTTTPASAIERTHEVDCGFATTSPLPLTLREGSGGRYTVALLPGGADPRDVEADVSCEVYAGDAMQTFGPFRFTGAGAAVGPVAYTLEHWETVQVCEVVQYTDGSPPTRTCPETVAVCWDCSVMDVVRPVREPVEAEICARTGGDVYVDDTWVFDCPAYGPYGS